METTREQIYAYFGPLLLEALTDIILKEINLLRQKAGLDSRTKQQLIDALKEEKDILLPYPGSDEEQHGG